jgi:hypothetical protein
MMEALALTLSSRATRSRHLIEAALLRTAGSEAAAEKDADVAAAVVLSVAEDPVAEGKEAATPALVDDRF